MQTDMHFYGVYAIARAAGLKDQTAYTIAYASQFVDDAMEDEEVPVSGNKVVLPTMTSHEALDAKNTEADDQWDIWVPFHFLPGGRGTDYAERLKCRKNSAIAQTMMNNVISQPFSPHKVGIATHIYADTFSHDGFAGIDNNCNKVDGSSITFDKSMEPDIIGYIKKKWDDICGAAAETVLSLGHGGVNTYPDRPYLKWTFKYEGADTQEERDNPTAYLDFCEKLHAYFTTIADANRAVADARKNWGSIKPAVSSILRLQKPLDDRIEAWRDALAGNTFSSATRLDQGVRYDYGKSWSAKLVGYKATSAGGEHKDTDAVLFFKAAREHRTYVINNLLPDDSIIV